MDVWILRAAVGLVACVSISAVPTNLGIQNSPLGADNAKSYCQQDHFVASCPDNSVIVITSALYGRMRLGRCVQGDYGHLGCRGDALPLLEAQCTGLRLCEFRIFDSNLKETKTDCPSDITAYLEASYSCQPVLSLTGEPCMGGHVIDVIITAGQPTYLASIDSELHRYGTGECPWLLKSGSGQRLRVSVSHFVSRQRSSIYYAYSCTDIALLTSTDGDQRSLTSCSARTGVTFTSDGSNVRLQLASHEVLTTVGRFIIKVEGVGCVNPVMSSHMTLVRDSPLSATLHCNATGRSWSLSCVDGHWLGERGNCTRAEGSYSPIDKDNSGGQGRFPYGILLVVAFGVALGIFSGGIMLTFISMFMKRRQLQQQYAKHQYGQCTGSGTRPVPPESALLDVTDSPYGTADVIPRDAHTAALMMRGSTGTVPRDCQSLSSPSHLQRHYSPLKSAAYIVATLPPGDYQSSMSVKQQVAPLAIRSHSPSLIRKTTLMGSRQFVTPRLDI